MTLSYNTATGVEGDFGSGGTPALDAKGWPVELRTWSNEVGETVQQRLATLMYREVGGNYPAGTYRAQWRGTGTVSFGNDATAISSGTHADGTHWADLNVTPTRLGILLKVNDMPPVADPTGVNPPAVDPIRDVHVWVPDYNGRSFVGQVWQPPTPAQAPTPEDPDGVPASAGSGFSPFHPLFTERLAPFRTLRFMDWAKTNVSANSTWAARRGWDEANQTGGDNKGVAVEYMVALANEIDADAWFNMPYLADDAFVRNFATYVRDHLEPGLKVNVEWSNEVWNSAAAFDTYGWVTAQLALPENAGVTRYQFVAREAGRDFDVWSDVFAAEPAGRLVRVVAGQAANPSGVTEAILKNMAGKFDAVACTGYFGLSSAQRASFDASTTAEDVARAVLANVPSATKGLKAHQLLAQQYGGGRDIKTYAYEAGQHADGQGNANLPYLGALHAAQTHPLMYEAYDDWLRSFYEMGGDLGMHFTYVSRNDRNGSWGALQAQTQPTADAPKYRALVEAATGQGFVPEYTVAAEQASGEEYGGAPVSFRVTRTGDKTLAQDVPYKLGGTASAADYVAPSGTVRFAAGQASALVTIVPVQDTIIEDAETVTLTLLAGAGYKLDGITARVTASATVADDDGFVNELLPIANAGFETGDLSGWTKVPATNNLIAVAPATVGGAVSNAPPAPAQGSRYAWGAGPSGGQGGGATTAGIAQRLDLARHATGIDAGNARIAFAGWGAGFSGDFAQLELRFYDAAGAQVGPLVAGNKANTDKTWTKLVADAPVPVLARSVELRAIVQRAGGTATDAGVDALSARFSYPVVPTVDVAATDPAAGESGGNTATFTATRSGNIRLDQPLTVHYAVAGTATAGEDFTALPGTVVIPAGSASATVTVAPLDDTLDEPDETVTLALVGKAQYVTGTSASATATIADDDLPRVLVSAVDDLAAEAGPDPATFVVERVTAVLDRPLTVRYTLGGTASNGADYASLSGTVTIPAGEAVAAVSLVPVDDATVERDETVVFTIAADSAYTVADPARATATIVNDDFPKVTVTATDAEAAERGADPATFTFARTGEFVGDDLTVYFTQGGAATAGEDYAMPAGGVTIPAGALSATVTLTPIADGVPEGPEDVVLTLVADAGYTPGAPAAARAVIADADSVSVVATDPSAAEAGPDPAVFTVSRGLFALDRALRVTYAVSGTAATSGADYAPLPGFVDVPAGQSDATVVVTPVDDAVPERTESVTLTVTDTGGDYAVAPAPGSVATANVADDDRQVVAVVATDADAAEAGRDPAMFTLTRTAGDFINESLAVRYTVGGTATAGADYAALSGAATIPAGADRVAVTVAPLDDTLVESAETVLLTVAADAAYAVGSPASATATITSDDVAAPATVVLRSPADAYVRDGTYAGTNFGGTSSLVVKRSGTADNTRRSYLRFDLSGVASVAAAKLRLFGALSSTANGSVTTTVYNSSNTSWPELATNWNNRPAVGTTSRGSVTVSGTTGKWYELDLTNFLKAEKAAARNLVTLALVNNSATDAMTVFNSDEAAANRPELVVTPADPPPPQGIVVSTPGLSVPEGGTASFTVSLAAQPTQDVVVAVAKGAGGDGDLSTGAGSLTFTSANWNVAQAVTVAAAEDDDATNGTASFSLSSAGLSGKSVAATEADNDAPAATTLRAGADAYVRDGTYAGTNFGTAGQLQVKQGSAGYTRESYVRFDLSPVSAVNSAKLRLFGKLDSTNAASAGFTVHGSTDAGWAETGVTWDTRLASGVAVASGTVAGTAGAWHEVNVTNFLAAEKAAGRNVVTLVIRAAAASPVAILFDSDEGVNRPELVVS